MRETGLYVGKSTALAATARGAHLQRQMAGGPLGRLMALATVITGHVPDAVQHRDKDSEKWCRGVLRGLGFDPDTHTLSRKFRHGRKGRGVMVLLVRDHLGEPQRTITERELEALQGDAGFLAGFGEECPA